MEIAHEQVHVNGIRLHCSTAGDPSAPHGTVLLLHGFPEFWYGWRHQIPALASAGFRVIAPDLRGYNLSDKPAGVRQYHVDVLAGDLLALIDQFGKDGVAHVVGHDWGGIVAWHAAMRAPQKIARLAILNAAHPAAYLRELRRPRQFLKSWYVFAFQLPRVPEAVIRANDYRALRTLFRTEPRQPFTPDEIERYVAAFRQPGALTAAINYYRAAFRDGAHRMRHRISRIDVPTLLIWGEGDRYMVPEATQGLQVLVLDLRVERLPQATHWVQHDEPDRVNALLIEHLTA